MAGKAAVLSGSVRTPLDAKRASDIACQFVAANKSVGTPSVSGGASSSNGGVNTLNPPAPRTFEQQTQTQAAACGSDTKLVINLLTVEGEEQVMLKVTVAEVQRSVLKQFGINIGAAINAGKALHCSPKMLCRSRPPPVLASCRSRGSAPRDWILPPGRPV